MPTLLDTFWSRVVATPDATLFTFVDDDGADAMSLTHREAYEAGAAVARALRERLGVRPGAAVLLVFPPSGDFVAALIGCLLAGAVAVPVAPPDPLRPGEDLERFARAAADCGARVALTSGAYHRARMVGRLRGLVVRPTVPWPDLTWHSVDASRRERAGAPPTAGEGDVAVLQYTSGSTSDPKGVMITHGNLEHQLACNAEDLGLTAASRSVLWVPHFHDFGLISGISSALYGNGRLWLLSPLAFVRRPAVWFDVMSRVRATHTAAPTFAYDLAVRKTTPAQRRRWDLRDLAVAMCAAEPISPKTARAFVDAFADAGLRRDAFCPAYGLAEHTVGVTVGGRAVARVSRDALERERRATTPRDDGDAREFVGCGRPSRGVSVRIVDPERCVALGDDVVGEVWVDSPSKALGYFRREADTRETFRAGLDGEGAWLRTGDLGFVREGELFVCGRRKDLLILRGRNLHPQDVEDTARGAHDAVRPGGVAAFTVEGDDGAEALVLVVEVRAEAESQAAAVARAVRARVAEHHHAACQVVVVARAGSVPRTTSGKVRRSAARAAFVRGETATARSTVLVHRADEVAAVERAPEGDPRLVDDAEFRDVVRGLVEAFEAMTRARGGRVFHRRSTTLAGVLTMEEGAATLRHPRFAPGLRYPVIVRHANGVQDDDAAIDNRGATVRVLEPGGTEDLDAGWLDLLLTTGPCFLAATADDFARWIAARPDAREAIARDAPHVAEAAWGMFRAASSFTALHYHAKTANRAPGSDGVEHLVRFRLVPERDGDADPGRVAPRGVLPPEVIPRAADDTRARTLLHDDLRARVADGIAWRLQVQRRERSDAALDCTRPWPEDRFPWTTVARLRLDRVVDDARVEGLRFDVFRAPEALRPPLATSPLDPASLAHARSLVYEAAGRLRTGAPLPDALAAWLGRAATPPRRVAVVGAGPAGLAAARRLEALGAQVTVFEQSSAVAGKCASLEVDGRPYDLGGHVCTPRYVRVAAWARALGVPLDVATPTRVFDAESRTVRERGDRDDVRAQWLRYQTLRAEAFPRIADAGLAHSAEALAEGAPAWFARHGLAALGDEIGVNYAACGYRRVREDDLPALYPVKGAEMAGLLSPDGDASLPPAWTVRGGFGAFWRRATDALRDVRVGCAVTGVSRDDEGVRVRHDGGETRFDAAVLAVPAEAVLGLLDDATDDERAVFGRVQTVDYRTLVVRARGLPTEGFYLVRDACDDPRAAGRVVAFHHRYAGSDVVLLYVYGDPSCDDAALEARVADDVRRLGGTLDAVLLHRPWRYFPHATPEALRDGFFSTAEAIQGARRTYFVGSLFGFELIECNVAFAETLVDAHFGGARPAPAAHRAEPATDDLRARLAAADDGAREPMVREYLRELLARELRLGAPPPLDARFPELGMDSVRSIEVFQRVVADTGLVLAPMVFFDHPTVAALARHLAAELAAGATTSARATPWRHTPDVVFDDVHGLGGVLDVYAPTGASNGLAVVDVVSMTWSSGREAVLSHQLLGTSDVLCERGFTVFAARTGSLSRFDGADMEATARAAVRYVRREAARYGVDPERIGLLGGSAGGHLAALVAAGVDPVFAVDDADVQALALFCPPTDLRHARGADHDPRACVRCRVGHRGGTAHLDDAAFDEAMRRVSPVYRVERRPPPPTLLFHATRDRAVPFDHATRFADALTAAGGEARVVARDSDRHPWPDLYKDLVEVAAWFDATLAAAPPRAQGAAPPWLDALPAPYRDDAAPPPDVRPARPREGRRGAVLLTGATGFLGVHLLAELLRRGDDQVLCVVRARDAAEGHRRLREAMTHAQVWDPSWRERIEVIPGDLTEPRFRLDAPAFEALAHRVDAVWHNGAVVQFGASYEALRAANVGGTREAVRLAARGGVPLHMVSSLGVFPYRIDGALPTEHDLPLEPDALDSGYARTKLVAELLVRAAAARGLSVTIHRPGLVSGATRTGYGNPDDLFARLVGGVADARVFPQELGALEVSLVPVDRVCAAMVALAGSPEHRGRTFHYFRRSETRFAQVRALLVARGHDVVVRGYDAFVDAVVARGAHNPLAGLLGLLRASRDDAMRLGDIRPRGFDASITDALLPADHWPPMDDALLGRYLDDLAARGALGERADADPWIALRDDWRARRGRITGAWQRYDLAWLARVDDDGRPAYDEAFARVAAMADEGARSSHPYAEFLAALTAAHTLARHRHAHGATEAARALLRAAVRAHAAMGEPPSADGGARYGRHFEFAGMAGRWLMPAHESAGLLACAADLVPDDARPLLERYAARRDAERVADDHAVEGVFDAESMRLHFGEHLPDAAFATEAARAYFARSPHGGATTPLAVRLHAVTGSSRAHLDARRARLDDGLHPAGVGQETQFALYYLRAAGVDLAPFADEARRVAEALTPDGVAIDDGGRAMDCDATAVSLVVAHATGAAVPFATSGLDRWWNPARRAYQSADEHDSYSVSTAVHVLEAFLGAPDVDRATQAAVWARTASLLEDRPWIELHHLSPLFIWEKIVRVLGAHADRFPEHPTSAHRDALTCVLDAQDPQGGGFSSAFTGTPNAEETALGLLALRAARRVERDPVRRDAIERAAARAAGWLSSWRERDASWPDLWVGKLTYAPVIVLRALVAAARAAP